MAIQILLADDKPAIAKIISLSLPREEYQITSVPNGSEAIAKASANPPQFLLIDVSLPYDSSNSNPDRDGFYVTQQIKAHPTLKKIKVILLTNAFEPVDEQKMTRYQADGVLMKPFEPGELRAKLRTLSEGMSTAVTAPSGAMASVATPSRRPTPPPPRYSDAGGLAPSGLDLGEITLPHVGASEPIAEGLSQNAQVLADFFAKEVATHQSEAEIPDFSTAAAEWKPKQPQVESDLSVWQRVDQVDRKGNKDIFDISNSTFEFSQDYLARMGLDALPPHPVHPVHPAAPPPLHQAPPRPAPGNAPRVNPPPMGANHGGPAAPAVTFGAPPAAAPAPPEPALSAAEAEAIIREETRLRCREIAEKVAWEVIPELAENLIRRELDKVMQELESHSPSSSS